MGAIQRKYGVATEIYIPMAKAGTSDFSDTGDWTPAAGDVKLTIDGADVVNITTLPVLVGGTGSKLWKFVFSAGEMTGKKISVQIVDPATKVVNDNAILIETIGHANAEHPFNIDAALGSAEIQAACQNAFVTSVAEGYPAKGAAGSIRDLLYLAIALLTNIAKVGTTVTAYKLDGTTPAATLTLDDADQPTSSDRAT